MPNVWRRLMMSECPANSPIKQAIQLGERSFIIERPETPDDVVREAEARGCAEGGYWAHLWPTSLALADFILHSSLIEPDTRVMEIGCGLGLVGIAAASRGADVILTDCDPTAVALAARNIDHNRLHARAAVFDWNHPPEPSWNPDLILGADVLYFERSHEPIVRLIASLGALAIIADPYRPEADRSLDTWHRHGLSCWTTKLRGCRIMMLQGADAPSSTQPPFSVAN